MSKRRQRRKRLSKDPRVCTGGEGCHSGMIDPLTGDVHTVRTNTKNPTSDAVCSCWRKNTNEKE